MNSDDEIDQGSDIEIGGDSSENMLNLYFCCYFTITLTYIKKKKLQIKRIHDFLFLMQTFSERSSCSSVGIAV